ncbi:TlpA family protein disulfide reductase [Pseudoalteromonas piscicida]|uniref:TlpA family protein disulfide reductase n=1 Tax=Pseudoalteromonas piscicida TaxID=43662 RepID=A0AAD0RLB7_PSEO7|nr:thioredoxin-like domain-containing protein [Pseudoalteromonas piscicida]ASD65638.1 redoxin domain protein [Pseudoalteromonas piscicida]AXR00683.1 TlpA family protein disulfide reductase [Pseudoalteromonas piscicida]
MKTTIKMLLLSTILATGLSGCKASNEAQPKTEDGYETYIHAGDTFKHLQFTDIKNQALRFDAKHKKLVILFATWCSDSQRLLSELKQSELLTRADLTIVAIGREETNTTLEQFNETMQLPVHFVADPNRDIYNTYANKGIPRVILLDEHNQVMQTLIGEQPNTLSKLNWN